MKKNEQKTKTEPTNNDLLNAVACVAIKLDSLIEIMDKVANIAEKKAKGQLSYDGK